MNGDQGGKEAGHGVTLEDLRKKMADFVKERDWDKFHSPRNVLLALVSTKEPSLRGWGAFGDISVEGEVPKGLPDWEEEEKVHLGEELSDVLLYLVRLSDICGVDLGKAALRKLELNARKYPVQQVSSKNDAILLDEKTTNANLSTDLPS
ncbi:hypothetical protein HPP92_020233 [Vanilla planifolia]|uniref:dCTP pyrophosphatase 1 n=1 Tax=Vanilla planifolia TaxID=51239 RepID=A0A835Q1Z5_VANPL|nr:hypothetical protein HPP92_020233 [Vanilla planifolia]